MSKGAALAYKPLGLAAGVTGGLIAGLIFKQVWKRVSGETSSGFSTLVTPWKA